ncbi:MAG: GNAT family N-acetyltransferase [Comamonas sp.]
MHSDYTLTIVDSLHDVDPQTWQALTDDNPFVSYHFLHLLQATGCVDAHSGWHARYLLLRQDEQLVGAAPCFVKTHSRGEFVFDHAWARAFAQHGLHYYPKLVVASPFTPVTGPRLLAANAPARQALAQALRQWCQQAQASSVHTLFAQPQDIQALHEAGFMVREGVQFHWTNHSYNSMDSFLAQLTQDKRKKMRQDSKYVAQAGITYRWLEGAQLQPEHIRFFYRCYTNTYDEHRARPYLSEEFFQRAHAEGILHFVLMLAERDEEPVACALNVRAADSLYGRYWGTTQFVRGLHFETCYMQSIAYCIAHQLQVFEGGAQGEHKMARGLLPVTTYSAHYIANRTFAAAIEDFLQRETDAVENYVQQLQADSPFKTRG